MLATKSRIPVDSHYDINGKEINVQLSECMRHKHKKGQQIGTFTSLKETRPKWINVIAHQA